MVFPSFQRFLVDGPKRIQYATCGREFFRTRRKKSPFSKISGYVWKGSKPRLEKEDVCLSELLQEFARFEILKAENYSNCGDLRVVKAIVYVLRFLRILSLHYHGFFVLLSWLNRTVFTFKKYHFGIKLRNCYIVQVSRNVTAKNESNSFFFLLIET